MKKLFLVLGLTAISIGTYAKSNVKVTNKFAKKPAECCTATLTYNGTPVDSETFCMGPSIAANCAQAKEYLLDRNPAAKKALTAN